MRLLPPLRRALSLCLLAAAPVAAGAQPTSFVFFGDSFVDAGNLSYLATLAGIPFPYPSGRVSDGAVWSERLAEAFGVAADGQALNVPGGRNYAVAGATTGTANVVADPLVPMFANQLGLQPQVQTYVAGTTPAANVGRMAVVFAGGNDFLTLGANPATSVANMVAALTSLNAAGVTQFLVPSLPDISRTPRGQALPPAQAATLALGVQAYNQGLAAALAGFAGSTGSTVLGLRLDILFANILAQPGAYGFTNTDDPCIPVPGYSVAPSCGTALFFDDLHPTTAAHAVIARAAATRIRTGVDVAVIPEPTTVALFGVGVVVLGAAARRRAA